MESISRDTPVVFNLKHGFEGRERGDFVFVVQNRAINRVVEMVVVVVVFSPGRRILILAIFHPKNVPNSGKHGEAEGDEYDEVEEYLFIYFYFFWRFRFGKEFIGNGKRNGGKLTERDKCSEVERKMREKV